MADFRWMNRSQEAAQLVAEGELTYPEVAEKVGVSRKTIHAWRTRPEFRSRVAEIEGEIGETVRRLGIARVEKRVEFQHERWIKMRRVIEARAADPAMAKVPGGTTGLLVRTIKGIGRGDDFQLVETYEVDTGLLKEIRELEKLTAEELGQRVERSEVGVSGHLAVTEAFERALEIVYGSDAELETGT